MHPRAKIVGSYRDGDGSMVLYLDRGSGQKLKPGMKGHVLQGADGDNLLDGGEFKIHQIVDSTKCIAKIPKFGLASLGAKNTRAVIHLIPWP
jgi:hypothetical protein